ncbi:MAG: SHOCT domain-containing protein [Microbacteriaceae bacterium]|nr:SHOCT domain-containing protein [Microbacteriaceae bacterium]
MMGWDNDMMGWYNDGIGWGGWIAMTVMMVAVWGLVIFAVVAIFRSTSIRSTGPAETAAPRDPMRTLDERFARGEIDAEEYHSRQAILRDSVHNSGR